MQRNEQHTKKRKEQIAATIYIFDAKITKKQLKDTELEPHQDEEPKQTFTDIQIRSKIKSFNFASSYPKQKTSHGLFTEQPLST